MSRVKNLGKLLGAVFLVCMAFLLTSCESRKTIVNGLDEKEANEIVVFLSSKGIDAMKVQSQEGGGGGSKIVLWDISVSADKATQAMSILNQSGLPRRKPQSLLGIFSNVGLVPSELQERIRYQAGLAEQIASTIRKIDGVLDAEVQISFPEEDPLNPGGEKKGKIVASVYVKHSGVLDDPNSHLVTKIKRLVAASVTGLDYDNVTVIGDRARFSEMPIGLKSGGDEKQFVSIWSIIVAKESAFRFRVIFFSFSLFLLLLSLAMIWAGWKLYPLLRAHGGIKQLFHLQPITAEPVKQEEKEVVKEETKVAEGEEEQDKGVT
ncbi:type III secretion system inner membrane ring lipoprotein SctJ [Parachlamydia sp. AcF125]|uniref:type III secretion system inner membrane ring lipoprotein SctJ n=1 Tax=Parachlamydia sp. AcF125 TaxID=2795736 RepID=UPI001BC938E1|nr:type III secretion inner membrane ring lipoprotein SctJ [Parachlamydia sp. AcF125]MBS4167877.1 Nodulation protein NolT [Parachlamydia sp. AcF125]